MPPQIGTIERGFGCMLDVTRAESEKAFFTFQGVINQAIQVNRQVTAPQLDGGGGL